jgi:hypothetical protein
MSHVHSLNTSPAKQKYSFGKEGRFKYEKATYSIWEFRTDVYYLPRIDSDRRSALIGYGQRSLAILNEKSSSQIPHAYNMPSSIDNKIGYSFKSGRYVFIIIIK